MASLAVFGLVGLQTAKNNVKLKLIRIPDMYRELGIEHSEPSITVSEQVAHV